LGITAIELADGAAPHIDMHPAGVSHSITTIAYLDLSHHYHQAMYMIGRGDQSKLSEPERWSNEFNDFIAKCLAIEPTDRPSAVTLLQVTQTRVERCVVITMF